MYCIVLYVMYIVISSTIPPGAQARMQNRYAFSKGTLFSKLPVGLRMYPYNIVFVHTSRFWRLASVHIVCKVWGTLEAGQDAGDGHGSLLATYHHRLGTVRALLLAPRHH